MQERRVWSGEEAKKCCTLFSATLFSRFQECHVNSIWTY